MPTPVAGGIGSIPIPGYVTAADVGYTGKDNGVYNSECDYRASS